MEAASARGSNGSSAELSATAAQLILADQINSTIQEVLTRMAAEKRSEPPKVGITLTCPAFEDSPIIGVLADFEEIAGRTATDIIGRNCRFLNQGCQNDKSALQFMRKIQASPAAARQFTCDYPEGKEFLLMNVRPTRTNPQGKCQSPSVFFFNLIKIFGFEVVVEDTSFPVLAGVQWAMLLDSNIAETTGTMKTIHHLLTSADSEIKEVFDGWCQDLLSQFIQLEKVSLRETEAFAVPRSLDYLKQDSELPADFEESTDCREKIKQLIAAVARAEEIAEKLMSSDSGEGEESSNQRHLAEAQRLDMVDLSAEVLTEFRSDLLQFMSWYVVKANLEGTLKTSPPSWQ
jgi:hypothetical protein